MGAVPERMGAVPERMGAGGIYSSRIYRDNRSYLSKTMENKKLFNWEIEKKTKEIVGDMLSKEKTLEDLETFVLDNNYYNGESDEVFIYTCNAYYKRAKIDKSNEVFKKLFDKWKVVSNKFPQNIQKLKHLADLIISKIVYVPDLMIEHFKKQEAKDLTVLISYCIDRYVSYDKSELLGEFLEKLPYDGTDPQTLFNLINATIEFDSDLTDNYLNRALASMKDPISFLNNINFTSQLFSVIHPDTLKKILDMPGINTKFHQFIKFESFMESLDKIPTLNAKFFIDISNQLNEKNTALAIQYGIRAIRKQDFNLEENLKELKCGCDNDPADQPSVAETLMIESLKAGDFNKIWAIVENCYFIHALTVSQYESALKYTAAAVKISNAKSELIAKHIQFLSRRMRSIDGPEGILEGDRYKHKEENAKFSQQIDAYRALYQKRTGKKFLI